MRERKVYTGKAGRWDARRNTSMIHAVPSGAGMELVALLRQRSQEEWYQWIRQGMPTLTTDEYAAARKLRAA